MARAIESASANRLRQDLEAREETIGDLIQQRDAAVKTAIRVGDALARAIDAMVDASEGRRGDLTDEIEEARAALEDTPSETGATGTGTP